MPMKINVDTATDFERVRLRARNDLLRVYNSKSYINEKAQTRTNNKLIVICSSVQFSRSDMSNSLRPH